MVLSQSEILKNQETFTNLLLSTNRPGITDLLGWLETSTDFFRAPSSTNHHGNFDGGLCQHSLNVYKALKKLIEMDNELALSEKHISDITEDTIIIISLLHDLCKVNFYKKDVKMWKDETAPYGSQWKSYYGYVCDDKYPLGHGEKSVIILQNFIKVAPVEAMAIRWHMGMTDPGIYLSPYTKSAMNVSCNDVPIVVLLQQADYMASFLMEKEADLKIDNAIN